jgi:hypothetical protein
MMSWAIESAQEPMRCDKLNSRVASVKLRRREEYKANLRSGGTADMAG